MSELPSKKNIFSKDYTDILSKDIFMIDSVLNTNSSAYKIKDLKGKKFIGFIFKYIKFLWKKYLLLSKLKTIY